MHVGENIFTLKFINFACSVELRIPDAKVSTMFTLRVAFESYTDLVYTTNTLTVPPPLHPASADYS